MSTRYQEIIPGLQADPKTWLVTGCAGFIGSNLLEALLLLDQKVVGLDHFSTGHQHNLAEVQKTVSARQWSNFTLHTPNIRHMPAYLHSTEEHLVGTEWVRTCRTR